MIPSGAIARGRASLASAFLTSSGQLRAFTQSGSRSDDGTWADVGSPVACCLYRPKGNEAPVALAMMDATTFMLAWSDDAWPITPQKRVVVAGVEYEIHDVPSERSNAFLFVAVVSRLK